MLDDAAAEAWREEQRRTYSSGDTAFLARQQLPVARHLVETAGIRSGERVLDVGAGTGNVAIEAARHGADVSAVDLTPRQVEAGRARCADEGVAVDWRVADAEQLPFADDAFDVVLSSFGVVYAADPARAAREIRRVLRSPGRALLTAYPRDSFNGEALELVNRHLPGAVQSPVVDEYLWSDPTALAGWFSPSPAEITRHDQLLEPRPSLAAWWDAMREVPIMARMRDALSPGGLSRFREELLALLAKYADVHQDGTVLPRSGYVIVRVTC